MDRTIKRRILNTAISVAATVALLVAQRPLPSPTGFGGGGGGGVTSVGLVGTANQITVTGTSPITGTGSWTLSLPSSLVLPNGTTATTQAANDNSTKVATTAYVNALTLPTIASTSNVLAGDGSGNAISAGFAPSTVVKGAANLTTTGGVPFQNGTTGTVTQDPGFTVTGATDSLVLNICGNITANACGIAVGPAGANGRGKFINFGGDPRLYASDGASNLYIGSNATTPTIINGTSITVTPNSGNVLFTTGISSPLYATATNCASGASPAVCSAAAAGAVAIPTGVTSVSLVVNTTAVTANSEILVQADDSVTIGGTTCNNTLATLTGGLAITARTAGTSFTITYNGTIATNPLCATYTIVN